MGADIPQWAKERACELANEVIAEFNAVGQWQPVCVTPRWDALFAFARYIAAHEDEPICAHEATTRALREAYGGAAPEFVSAFTRELADLGFEVTKIEEQS